MSAQKPEEEILQYLSDNLQTFIDERYPPVSKLASAINYSLGGKGKRVRPVLALMTAEAMGGDVRLALPSAIAIEMVHAYSLIHDDLPCMDDDDIRRGKPSCHIKFDESTALLAGDGLLTDAFEVLANLGGTALPDRIKLAQVIELASASGSRGMVWGQALDLYWTDREGASEDDIDDIHVGKTGCLMGAACALGAYAAGASAEEVSVLRNFGRTIGLAFQIRDDILDNTKGTGKTPGKDKDANKLTYLRFMNIEEAEINSRQLTDAAIEKVKKLGRDTDKLIKFSKSLVNRND